MGRYVMLADTKPKAFLMKQMKVSCRLQANVPKRQWTDPRMIEKQSVKQEVFVISIKPNDQNSVSIPDVSGCLR